MATALELPAVGLFGGSPALHHSAFIHAMLPEPAGPRIRGISVRRVMDDIHALGVVDQ